jgi:hypothetical protein
VRDAPTLEEARTAKDRVAELLRGRTGLAGIGIGQHEGQLVVRVNWRQLPPDIETLDRVGTVMVRHQLVGNVRTHRRSSPEAG